MKVYSKAGSKERLFEMMSGVDKTFKAKLNEAKSNEVSWYPNARGITIYHENGGYYDVELDDEFPNNGYSIENINKHPEIKNQIQDFVDHFVNNNPNIHWFYDDSADDDLNEIKINEQVAPDYVMINNIIDQIKSGKLKANYVTNNLNGNVTELSLSCSDNSNHFTAYLTFEITFNQNDGSDAGVYDINEVKLISFETVMNSHNYVKTFDDNAINQFNLSYGENLVDFVENYLDVDTDTETENIVGIDEETATLVDSIIKNKDGDEIHKYY